MSRTLVRSRALSGTFRLLWTCAKKREKGSPPSLFGTHEISYSDRLRIEGREKYRAKANNIRLLVVITVKVHTTRHTSGILVGIC